MKRSIPYRYVVFLMVLAMGCKQTDALRTPPVDKRTSAAATKSDGLVKAEDVQITSLRVLVEREYMEKANLALAHIVKSQEFAAIADYRNATDEIMRSIYVYPTADAYALAGSLYHVQNDPETAAFYWDKAYQADPDIGRRGYIGLSSWIESTRRNRRQ